MLPHHPFLCVVPNGLSGLTSGLGVSESLRSVPAGSDKRPKGSSTRWQFLDNPVADSPAT